MTVDPGNVPPEAPEEAAHTGTLIASGIIEPRADEVITAMDSAGMSVCSRRDDGEWVSLELRHRA